MRKVALFWVLLLLVGSPSSASVKAPDFSGGVWLEPGTKVPHSIKGFRGRVLLVDFWEYTCINCIRDFAVLKRWYAKYHPFGLEIVGVHYGEFAIGYKVENVRRAADRFRLPWPIVVDLQGSIWRAYQSEAWPNRYLIDPAGNIVLQVKGEGDNARIEAALRQLLQPMHPEISRIPLDPDENTFAPPCGHSTEETYVGDWFGHGAVENQKGYDDGFVVNYASAAPPGDGKVMLSGKWRTERDGVTTADKDGGKAALRYHARSVYAVLSVENPKSPVRVYLWQDGKPLARNQAGKDLQFDSRGSYLEIEDARMYDLVRNSSFGEHLLTLDAQAKGFTLYSFTYGNNCQQDFGD